MGTPVLSELLLPASLAPGSAGWVLLGVGHGGMAVVVLLSVRVYPQMYTYRGVMSEGFLSALGAANTLHIY